MGGPDSSRVKIISPNQEASLKKKKKEGGEREYPFILSAEIRQFRMIFTLAQKSSVETAAQED